MAVIDNAVISGNNAVFSCKGGTPSTGIPIRIYVFRV